MEVSEEGKAQINIRVPEPVFKEIGIAAAKEAKKVADFIRVAALTAACHTFRGAPLPVFIASGEHMTLERARALGMTPVADVGGTWGGEVRAAIGKNGLFRDNAGGVWVLTAEGLKQVMGFDPGEEKVRVSIAKKSR